MSTTQAQRILQHMQEHGSISQLQAFNLYAITRLGARIFDLRASGHKITREMVTAPNRFGEKTRYAVYYLHDEDSLVGCTCNAN